MKKNDLIICACEELMSSYKNLLLKLERSINKNCLCAYDEVSKFWFLNKNKIAFILDYIGYEYKVFFFCGGYLNLENHEHYPFFLLGDFHVIDDSLNFYLQISNSSISSEKINGEIRKCIKQNISLINAGMDNIIILPISSYVKLNIIQQSKELFKHFFEPPLKNKEVSSFESLKNIIERLNSDIVPYITFSSSDSDLKLEESFKEYVDIVYGQISDSKQEISLFCSTITAFVCKSYEIINICILFNFFPYIRFRPVFQIMYLIFMQNKSKKSLNDLEKISGLTYLISNYIDFSSFYNLDIVSFIKKIRVTNVSNRLIERVSKIENFFTPDFSDKVRDIIKSEFDLLK